MNKKILWKVHLPNLMKELIDHTNINVLTKPMVITCRIIDEIATRAAELNDPELNALMCRLTLYEIADPQSEAYDLKAVKSIYAAANVQKRRQTKCQKKS